MKKAKNGVHYEKVFIVTLTSLLVFFSVGNVVKADDYPNRPINLVIPVAAGGPTDQMLRMLTPQMEKILKTPIAIQYKVGGGGTIGYSWLSREKPDGYTIGSFSGSVFLQQYGKTGGVKIDAFDFISNFAYADTCLAVPVNSPFKTLKDLLDYAKKNPGHVTISNSGTGANTHLPAAALEKEAGVKFTHVPMDGESTALMAMLGGHVSAASVSIGLVGEYLNAKKVRVLSVNTEKRMATFPDIPTLKEQGVNFQYGTPVGLFGPKGIPESRLKMLSNAIGISFQSDQFQRFMQTLGFRPVFYDYKQTSEMAKAEDAKILNLYKLVNLYEK
jgi:tripartite-type tricarboxylate transporter receptor subunit TctC